MQAYLINRNHYKLFQVIDLVQVIALLGKMKAPKIWDRDMLLSSEIN